MRDQVVATPAVSVSQVTMDLVRIGFSRWFYQEICCFLLFLNLDFLLSEVVQIFMLVIVTFGKHIHNFSSHNVVSFECFSDNRDDWSLVDDILEGKGVHDGKCKFD